MRILLIEDDKALCDTISFELKSPLAVIQNSAGILAHQIDPKNQPLNLELPDYNTPAIFCDQEIIQLHGGKLSFIQTPSGGCTFIIQLPL